MFVEGVMEMASSKLLTALSSLSLIKGVTLILFFFFVHKMELASEAENYLKF